MLFLGLGVLAEAEPVRQSSPGSDGDFDDLRFHLQFLDLTPWRGQIEWAWMAARSDPTLSLDEESDLAPPAWRRWVRVDLSI